MRASDQAPRDDRRQRIISDERSRKGAYSRRQPYLRSVWRGGDRCRLRVVRGVRGGALMPRRSEPASQVPRPDDVRIVYSARVLSGALPQPRGVVLQR